MNDDKLKELEKLAVDGDFYAEGYLGNGSQEVLDLITACRQLEKDNSELLAALKDIKEIADLNKHWSCKRIIEITKSFYTKHKGE